mgnify:CR=1 FL=1
MDKTNSTPKLFETPEAEEWVEKIARELLSSLLELLRNGLIYLALLFVGGIAFWFSLNKLSSPLSEVIASWILASYSAIAALLLKERFDRARAKRALIKHEALELQQSLRKAEVVVALNRDLLSGFHIRGTGSFIQKIGCEGVFETQLVWRIVGSDVIVFHLYDYVVAGTVHALSLTKRRLSWEDEREIISLHEDLAKAVLDVTERILLELTMKELIIEKALYSWDEMSRVSGANLHAIFRSSSEKARTQMRSSLKEIVQRAIQKHAQ